MEHYQNNTILIWNLYVLWTGKNWFFNLIRGFVFIYDGNFKDAIETFRKILEIKPANIIASNNCATCQMYDKTYLTYRFMNETLRAIESMEKLIKFDPRKNLNE